MDIRAVAFDVNGTLVRILTDDDEERIFRAAAHFLTYQGIDLHRHELRDLYFQIMKEQLRASPEKYPEFDAVGIWRSIIEDHGTDFTRALPAGKLAADAVVPGRDVPRHLAPATRPVPVRRRGARRPARATTRSRSSPTRRACMPAANCTRSACSTTSTRSSFPATTGTASPTRRLFQFALDGMGVAAGNTLYVGNDMYRDIYGAREAGLTTVMFDSDQGAKVYRDCAPDYTITDFRDLLQILGLPWP